MDLYSFYLLTEAFYGSLVSRLSNGGGHEGIDLFKQKEMVYYCVLTQIKKRKPESNDQPSPREQKWSGAINILFGLTRSNWLNIFGDGIFTGYLCVGVFPVDAINSYGTLCLFLVSADWQHMWREVKLDLFTLFVLFLPIDLLQQLRCCCVLIGSTWSL